MCRGSAAHSIRRRSLPEEDDHRRPNIDPGTNRGGASVSQAQASRSRDWHPDPFRTLVTIGDAVTAGGDASARERCWASVLAALISDFLDEPVRLVNVGIGGNVISTRSPVYERSGKPAADERVHKHVIDHRPDLLVVSYGLNDARGGTPVELFGDELIELLKAIRGGCDPLIVLLGPYFMTDFSVVEHFQRGSHAVLATFNLVTEQVARDHHCLFSDVYHAFGGQERLVTRRGSSQRPRPPAGGPRDLPNTRATLLRPRHPDEAPRADQRTLA